MFTRHENKGKYFRGRGRGKHKFSQGRNHENLKEERKDGETSHKSYNRNNFKKSSYDTSKLLCFKCKEYGHFANKCPSKKEEQSNLIEKDLEPTLLISIKRGQHLASELVWLQTEIIIYEYFVPVLPGIKEDIYAARTPIGRQSVGSITNQKHDQHYFKKDHNKRRWSKQKNDQAWNLRQSHNEVEVTEGIKDLPGCKDDHKHYKKSKQYGTTDENKPLHGTKGEWLHNMLHRKEEGIGSEVVQLTEG
ncbi:zinc finger, CCHC-type containing protein [Tanacetum coccineum]